MNSAACVPLGALHSTFKMESLRKAAGDTQQGQLMSSHAVRLVCDGWPSLRNNHGDKWPSTRLELITVASCHFLSHCSTTSAQTSQMRKLRLSELEQSSEAIRQGFEPNILPLAPLPPSFLIRVSYILGWPQTVYVSRDGTELLIFLPQLPSVGVTNMFPHSQVT